jgi:hypothetical protein
VDTIFLGDGRTRGFKNWSAALAPASNDDDPPGGGRPVAIRLRAAIEPTKQTHRPLLRQGMGNVL